MPKIDLTFSTRSASVSCASETASTAFASFAWRMRSFSCAIFSSSSFTVWARSRSVISLVLSVASRNLAAALA